MFLTEGGVGGHMSHLYDNPRLTFADIKEILQSAAEGQLEGTEKTDGQNLFISFSVPEQKAKGVRNKANIKAGGLDAKELAKKFEGRGALEKTFSDALSAFEEVVKEMSEEEQVEIFGPDTNVYFSAEIIDPRTANLINYNTKTLAIHRGGAEFNKETGDPIRVEIEDPNYPGHVIEVDRDVSRNAEVLDRLLKAKQEEIENRDYGVEMDAIMTLQGLEDQVALKTALSELENEISSEGISDNQTVLEYIMAKISNWFTEEGLSLDEETEKRVLQKILLSDKTYRYAYGYGNKLGREWNKTTILKDVPDDQKENVRRAIDNAPNILKKAIAPIEMIIHDFSVEMLKSLKSIFILDNEKELERQRKEVELAILSIEKYKGAGSDEAMAILQKQMEKLKSVENISTAAEGFVFDYDGHTYKFTGNFAPMNQLLGLFKYGRKGVRIPKALQVPRASGLASKGRMKLSEEEEFINEVVNILLKEQEERYVVLIPGGFKPPHKGHYAMIENYAEMANVESVVILSGDKPREGITKEMSQQLFELYGGLSDKVQFVDHNLPFRAAFEKLGEEEFVNQFSDDVTFALGCSDKGNDEKRATNFARWFEKNPDQNILNVNVGTLSPCPVESSEGIELSASKMREAARDGDDETLQLHIPENVDLESVKNILSTNNESKAISEMIFEIIEEVYSERQRQWACSQIDDPDELTKAQAEEMCSSEIKEEELEELKVGGGGGGMSKRGPPKADCKQCCGQCNCPPKPRRRKSFSSEEDPFDPIEEISGAGAAGGYSLPLGQEPKRFNSPRPKVKGIKIYTRRSKGN